MILVTGATGHLGNVIVRQLVATKKKVRAFVLPNDDIRHIIELPIEIVYGNVLDIESIEKALIGCNYIIHTAALVSIGNTFSSKDIYNVNVNGLENVLNTAIKQDIKKVIYVSSIHAFNELKNSLTITEETPTDPNKHIVPYAKSKAMALEVVKKKRQEGLVIDILFPTGIIGPYDYKKANNALFPIRLLLSSKKKRIYYFKAGYDFVDVRDVAKISIQMINCKKENNEYIISGEYITLKNIYATIAAFTNANKKYVKVPRFFLVIGIYILYFFTKIFKKKSPITPQAFRILTSKHHISSNKVRKELKFKPLDIKESLIDSVVFIENNREKPNYGPKVLKRKLN